MEIKDLKKHLQQNSNDLAYQETSEAVLFSQLPMSIKDQKLKYLFLYLSFCQIPIFFS